MSPEADYAAFMSNKIPGRSGGEPTPYVLDIVDRDIIRLALRGDVDMRRYVPEVMSLCSRLDISEPLWMEDEAIRERVELNRLIGRTRELVSPGPACGNVTRPGLIGVRCDELPKDCYVIDVAASSRRRHRLRLEADPDRAGGDRKARRRSARESRAHVDRSAG
jgi:hypothetical protein